jgi:hypothetical protein
MSSRGCTAALLQSRSKRPYISIDVSIASRAPSGVLISPVMIRTRSSHIARICCARPQALLSRSMATTHMPSQARWRTISNPIPAARDLPPLRVSAQPTRDTSRITQIIQSESSALNLPDLKTFHQTRTDFSSLYPFGSD